MSQEEWEELVVETELYISRLEKASLSVGELFYDGFQVESNEIFRKFLNGFLDIMHAIIVTVESSAKFNPSFKERVMPYIQQLLSYFEEFELLFSQERWVALADTLKYELPKQLQNVFTVFKELHSI